MTENSEVEGATDSMSIPIPSGLDTCPICYEGFFVNESDIELGSNQLNLKEKLTVDGCGHEFCRECLTDHCKHAISVREVPIACPAKAEHSCVETLEEAQVKDLLCRPEMTRYGSISSIAEGDSEQSTLDWIRFQRLQRILQNPSLLACPKCQDLLCREANVVEREHQMACPTCNHRFCAIHGDAHPNKTCAEYSNSKRARQERKSEKVISRFTKPCSHCGAFIEKISGCDHIVCSSCKQDMCFRCGTHIHLSGDMIRSCEKCQQNFVDHRHIWAYRLTLCLSLPFYLPICLVHILIVGIMAIATCGCFCCLGCGTAVKEVDGSREERTFSPLKGARVVCAIVFLPAVDLARQCGIRCCCELDLRHIATNDTILENEDSEEEMPPV